MPTHPAADNGGQRHLVRETVAGFFIGQALYWEKQLTPSQHGHPALLPQGTDQAREGHGRDVPEHCAPGQTEPTVGRQQGVARHLRSPRAGTPDTLRPDGAPGVTRRTLDAPEGESAQTDTGLMDVARPAAARAAAAWGVRCKP